MLGVFIAGLIVGMCLNAALLELSFGYGWWRRVGPDPLDSRSEDK